MERVEAWALCGQTSSSLAAGNGGDEAKREAIWSSVMSVFLIEDKTRVWLVLVSLAEEGTGAVNRGR